MKLNLAPVCFVCIFVYGTSIHWNFIIWHGSWAAAVVVVVYYLLFSAENYTKAVVAGVNLDVHLFLFARVLN